MITQCPRVKYIVYLNLPSWPKIPPFSQILFFFPSFEKSTPVNFGASLESMRQELIVGSQGSLLF